MDDAGWCTYMEQKCGTHCTASHLAFTVLHLTWYTLYCITPDTQCTASHLALTVLHLTWYTMYHITTGTYCTASNLTHTMYHITPGRSGVRVYS